MSKQYGRRSGGISQPLNECARKLARLGDHSNTQRAERRACGGLVEGYFSRSCAGGEGWRAELRGRRRRKKKKERMKKVISSHSGISGSEGFFFQTVGGAGGSLSSRSDTQRCREPQR